MIVATIDTRHFSFLALGADRLEAEMALLAAWQQHHAQYEDADPAFMADMIEADDVTFIEMSPGQAARDGEVFE